MMERVQTAIVTLGARRLSDKKDCIRSSGLGVRKPISILMMKSTPTQKPGSSPERRDDRNEDRDRDHDDPHGVSITAADTRSSTTCIINRISRLTSPAEDSSLIRPDTPIAV